MEEILKHVSVAEYPLFRSMVLAHPKLGWSRTKYNARKIGRNKIHPLEMDILWQIVEELPSHKQPTE